MVMTPGLRPFSEDTPERKRDKAAIGIKEYQSRTPALRPTAAPTNTYARPEQPVRDDNLARLADSLGQLNPALLRFGSQYQAEKKDDTESLVQSKLASAGSQAEVDRLMAEDPDVKSAVGSAAAMRFIGKQQAAKAMQEMADRYQNGFDRQNGDIDQFTSEALKPYLDRYGDNPQFRKAFMDDVLPGIERIKQGHAAFRSGETYQQTQQATTDVFLGTVRKGEAEGISAQDQAKAVFAEFYGNKKFLGLPYQDQMKALAQVVTTLANEGKYDVVKAIGELDRTAVDGGHVGKLLDNNLVGPSIAQAMLTAKSVRDKANHEGTIDSRQGFFDRFSTGNATPEDEVALREMVKKNDGSMTESTANSWIAGNRAKREALQEEARKQAEKAQLSAALNGQEATLTNAGIEAMKEGRLFSLPQVTILNKQGAEETLTPEEYRKRAGEDYEKYSNKFAQQNGETWEQKTLRELPVFAKNGYIPKQWKDTFAAGGNAISAAAAHGTDLPEPAQKAYAMYKLLRANDAQMLRDLVPKDQTDLFEAWRVGEEELHIDPKKALIAASAMNADPTNRLNRSANSSVKQIKQAVSSGFDGYEWVKSVFGGVGNLIGESDLSDKIGRRAEWYAGMGVGVDKSLELAAKSVKDTHINVNGWWIDASDKRLPKEFPTLATDIINAYVAKHGKAEGLEAKDLTIREAGNGYGAWRIVRKNDGVAVDQLNDAIFTPADLMQEMERKRSVEDQKLIDQMKTNSKKPIRRFTPPTAEEMRNYD